MMQSKNILVITNSTTFFKLINNYYKNNLKFKLINNYKLLLSSLRNQKIDHLVFDLNYEKNTISIINNFQKHILFNTVPTTYVIKENEIPFFNKILDIQKENTLLKPLDLRLLYNSIS